MLALLYGYASAISLSPFRVRFCGGRFDSFLGFEYVVMITLASHVFEYFLRFLLQACVICAFWFRWGSHGVTPLLSCLLSRFPPVRSLYWVFRLLSCWSELQLRWRRSTRRLQRRFFCWPCAVRLCGGFLPNFAIFALVSDHLRNFCFYSWDSLLVLTSLFRLPILLSLYLLWWLALGSQLQPTFSGGPCCLALWDFLSVAAVLYLLLPTPATGVVSSCWASLVCLFSWSWYTCSGPFPAVVCPSIGRPGGTGMRSLGL